MFPKAVREIDLHVHAGQERQMPMQQMVQTFIDLGVHFLGLLDHSELYEMGNEALRAQHGQVVYDSSAGGLLEFYLEVERMKRLFPAASIYKGLEIGEWDLFHVDSGFLDRADFVGCHMNTSCHDPNYRHFEPVTCGEHLTRRAKELLTICKPEDKPAVLFHPFHRRLQELRAKIGSDDALGEASLLTDEDVDTLANGVDRDNLCIELNFGDLYTAATHPELLELLGRVCHRLRDAGFPFSLGSDYHITPKAFRDPTDLVASLGMKLEDFGLVQMLIARPSTSTSTQS